MSDVSVDIFPDQSSPLGGYAVIRFNGLWLLPPNATFTIEPVDDKLDVTRESGWPVGKRRPLETRVTSKGIEIVVGPEIVDAPLLLPGTPVAISVPDASVRVEVRWPNLPASKKKRGESLVVSAEQLLTEVAALERARLSVRGVAPPSITAKPHVNGSGGHAHAPAVPDAAASNIAMAAPVKLEALGATPAAKTAAAKKTSTDPPVPPAKPAAVATVQVEPEAPVEEASPPVARRPAVAFVAGFAVAMLVSGALWFVLRPAPPRASVDLAGAPPPVVQRIPALHAAFWAGPTSPRGRPASSVELPAALMLADQSLHGPPGNIDREEAAFWLRKALSNAVSGAQLNWALTQLGTIYAEERSGPPDYQMAKTLWEIAAAHGDPVAMCFLASLHEHGLGVPRNKKAALEHYVRAKEHGGCPGLEQSLARLSE